MSLAESLFKDIKKGETILEMRGITKVFPGGVVANDHIDFDLKAGEIHVLLGENGAGKTTLMNILYGLFRPDEGEIYIRGRKVEFKSPLDAIRMGIGMVHQHRRLIPVHTVLENIVLGHPKVKGMLDLHRIEQEVKELCENYGFKLDLKARVWQLSAGEKQMVEIIKALYRGARILILDEPTSELTLMETERLLESLQRMAEKGLGIIPFVTHKLPIVLKIADRITILRKGKVVARLKRGEATMIELAKKMVGREVLFRIERVKTEIGKPILEVRDLHALSDRGVPAVKGISFSVREGEIFGIAGVTGNGQQELAEVLMGLRKPIGGKIIFEGKDITNASILERWKMGMGYIPPERELGAIKGFSIVENLAMSYYFNESILKLKFFLDYEKLRKLAADAVSEFNIVTPSLDSKAGHLSGGNLQKLILARVMSMKPKLLIANLPTHGLDVGATEFVRNKLMEYKKEGAAIILISEDLDEILSLSDVIAPIYEGKFMGIVPAEKADRAVIGALMSGVKYEEMT